MSYNIPSQPVKFIFEITFFFLILVPAGILWACVKKCLPVKRKSVKVPTCMKAFAQYGKCPSRGRYQNWWRTKSELLSDYLNDITGAAAGLGRQLALLFANLGAKIVCLDINEEGNDKTAQMVKETGAVVASYKCDISKRDQIKDIHQRVKKEIGPVDILINNAAIVWGHIYLDPTKDQLIDDIIDVNLKGQFWMNREIIPSMIDRKSGHIVTISSLAAVCGVSGISSYTATKWATNGMMESMRDELNELNELISSSIKTTTIMPYFINTNPKISERLDCRFPEIPIETAGRLIVRGILEEKQLFSVPNHMYPVYMFIRFLPENLQKVFRKIVHVKFIPDDEEQQIIDRYQGKM